jgi:histidine triad (HIT) family protein
MASLFTRIIAGELPGRFVWKDEHCVAFLTIEPIRPGHTLVVPRAEIEHWIDVPAELSAHLHEVARTVSTAIHRAWKPPKVGLMVAGLEVPHVHYHLIPIWELGDMSFARADRNALPEAMDQAAEMVRTQLREMGREEVADA